MYRSSFIRHLNASRVLLFSIVISAFIHVAVISGYFRVILSSDADVLRGKGALTVNLKLASPAARKPSSFFVDDNRSLDVRHQADKAEPQGRLVNQVLSTRRYLEAPIQEQDYLSGDIVSERPQIMEPVDLALPGVDLSGISGVAELQLLVSSSGRIDAIVIADSSLPDEVINHAVRQFMKVQMRPGRINNAPVRSRMRIELFLANSEQSGIRAM